MAGPAEWNLITRQEVTEKTGKGLVNDLLRAQRQFVESLLLEFIMGFLGSSQHQQFPQLVMICPRTSYFFIFFSWDAQNTMSMNLDLKIKKVYFILR